LLAQFAQGLAGQRELVFGPRAPLAGVSNLAFDAGKVFAAFQQLAVDVVKRPFCIRALLVR